MKGSKIEFTEFSEELRDWYAKAAASYVPGTEEKCSGNAYVFALSRRCTNLLEYLSKEFGMKNFSEIMTENALLMNVPEIAEHYFIRRAFPPIAIFDDVLVHGRNIDNIFWIFLSSVKARLKAMGLSRSMEALQLDFTQAVTIWVFAANDAPLLLHHSYQWKVRCKKILPEEEWRGISRIISDAIWESRIPNTSYVISAIQEGQPSPPMPQGWLLDESISYRSGSQSFWVHGSAERYTVTPSVRSYLRDGARLYIPYFFTEALDLACIRRAFEWLIQQLRSRDNSVAEGISELFAQVEGTHKMSHYVCYQLFETLLSQITLSVFFRAASVSRISYDTHKIARNYGQSERIKPVLDGFCALEWTDKELEDLCRRMELPPRESTSDVSVPDPATVVELLEDRSYQLALEHEIAAKKLEASYSHGRGMSRPRSISGEQPLGDFLASAMNGETGGNVTKLANVIPLLSCLTQMMDSGDLALKAKCAITAQRIDFYPAVHATEMTASILPRRLGDYFPQFYQFSRLFWRESDYPQKLENYFGNILRADRRTLYEAVRFAKLIKKHQGTILGHMLNWRGVIFRN